MATRKYEQRLRAESAEETRRRILDALYERLREAPEKPVSVDQIARLAGVSRSTVYLVFGSRSGLFVALVEEVLERGGWDRVAQAIADPDPLEHLRGALAAGTEMVAAERDLFRVLWSMETLNADAMGGVMARLEKRRRRGMSVLARRLDREGLLRPGVSVEEATNLLFLLSSFDAFDVLYSRGGLSVEAISDLLVSTARRSLCR